MRKKSSRPVNTVAPCIVVYVVCAWTCDLLSFHTHAGFLYLPQTNPTMAPSHMQHTLFCGWGEWWVTRVEPVAWPWPVPFSSIACMSGSIYGGRWPNFIHVSYHTGMKQAIESNPCTCICQKDDE
jgi:hypothetical protein